MPKNLHLQNQPTQARRNPPLTSQGGFTLVELLTVLAIVATLTYLAGPALASLSQSGNFKSNSSEIGDLLKQAYSSALSKNSYVWVGFAQTTTNGQSGVEMASVYSPHEDRADFPANVNLLTKPIFLPNLSLTTITSQITDPDRATTSVCQITDATLGSFSAPGNGLKQPLSYVVEISPSGQVTTSSTNKYAWMEIGLINVNSNKKNVAVLQMNAFTGRVSIYQP